MEQKNFAELFSHKVVGGVQPMSQPAGIAFAMRTIYKDIKQAQHEWDMKMVKHKIDVLINGKDDSEFDYNSRPEEWLSVNE